MLTTHIRMDTEANFGHLRGDQVWRRTLGAKQDLHQNISVGKPFLSLFFLLIHSLECLSWKNALYRNRASFHFKSDFGIRSRKLNSLSSTVNETHFESSCLLVSNWFKFCHLLKILSWCNSYKLRRKAPVFGFRKWVWNCVEGSR